MSSDFSGEVEPTKAFVFVRWEEVVACCKGLRSNDNSRSRY